MKKFPMYGFVATFKQLKTGQEITQKTVNHKTVTDLMVGLYTDMVDKEYTITDVPQKYAQENLYVVGFDVCERRAPYWLNFLGLYEGMLIPDEANKEFLVQHGIKDWDFYLQCAENYVAGKPGPNELVWNYFPEKFTVVKEV